VLTPSSDDEIRLTRQKALLLHHLNRAPNGKLSRSAANGKIAKPLQTELALTPAVANEVRETLASNGLLTESAVRGSTSYTITEVGRAALRDLQSYVPLQPAKGTVKDPAEPFTRASQEAFILLQLVGTPDGGETATNLNKKPGDKKLGLTAATARSVRGLLVVEGLIAVTRTARSEKYSLTAEGVARLVAASFDEFKKLDLTGPILTQMLRAARARSAPDRPEPTPSAVTQHVREATPEQIQETVLSAFQDLRRERHALTGRVPIHEVRDLIGQKFGSAVASHETLDPIILGLWREKRFRLNPIVDLARATHEQLQDSIPGVGETLFHLEAPQ